MPIDHHRAGVIVNAMSATQHLDIDGRPELGRASTDGDVNAIGVDVTGSHASNATSSVEAGRRHCGHSTGGASSSVAWLGSRASDFLVARSFARHSAQNS